LKYADLCQNIFPGITEDDVKPPIGIVDLETWSQVTEAWGLDYPQAICVFLKNVIQYVEGRVRIYDLERITAAIWWAVKFAVLQMVGRLLESPCLGHAWNIQLKALVCRSLLEN